MTEQQIINSCQKWNLEFFSILYEKYFEEIYKFIYLKTFDKETAQDICSETFFKAINKINSFKNEENSNFRAWIYRIAYNLVIDNYKQNNEDLSLEYAYEIWNNKDFWEDFDNKQKIKKVLKYLDKINPKHKQIIIMRIWDDLSYSEISQVTWESLDNCKKVVSRTLAKIPSEILLLAIILSLKI